MDDLSKDKIEEGKSVDDIEDDGTLVPYQSLDGVAMGISHEMGEVPVHDSAEDQVEADTQDPAKEDLVVGVDSMVDSTEGDAETSEESGTQ